MIPDKLQKLLIKAGELALQKQKTDGSMPAGRNGPHNHNMTPARNTSHFSILFGWLYQSTQKEKWRKAAVDSLDKLLSLRVFDGSFWHRRQDFKTSYNGLIGQAWSLEALLSGYWFMDDRRYLVEAQSLVDSHRFNMELGLWHELGLDGSIQGINSTLNQQIWFSSMALKTYPDTQRVREYIHVFLDNLIDYIRFQGDGLVSQKVFYPQENLLKDFYRDVLEITGYSDKKNTAIGYHVFTLTGLCFLFEENEDHKFFQSKHFNKMLDHCFSRDYLDSLAGNWFGYQYNVPGFEIPYIYSVFKDRLSDDVLENSFNVFEHQVIEHYSESTGGLLGCNSFDLETLAARIYELTRIRDVFWRDIE